jgi:hypothetical protein
MKKLPPRAENLRRALAQEAARVMAEHGIRDFLFAKRKAAERFGVVDGSVLPRNTEIEEALQEYQRLFGGDAHLESLQAQRGVSNNFSRGSWAQCCREQRPSTTTSYSMSLRIAPSR